MQVRIFSTSDGSKLRELRRGSDPATIYSLAFSRGDQPAWVAVTSDKGTAHVFSLAGSSRQQQQQQAGSGGGRDGGGSRGGGSSGAAGSGNGQQQPTSGAASGVEQPPQSRGNPLSALSFVSVSGRGDDSFAWRAMCTRSTAALWRPLLPLLPSSPPPSSPCALAAAACLVPAYPLARLSFRSRTCRWPLATFRRSVPLPSCASPTATARWWALGGSPPLCCWSAPPGGFTRRASTQTRAARLRRMRMCSGWRRRGSSGSAPQPSYIKQSCA